MKKIVKITVCIIIVFCTCLAGCSSNGNSSASNKEQEIVNILTNTNYTYDTLVRDLIEYCAEENSKGKLSISKYSSRYANLKNNDSVKPLLDMTLDGKLLAKNFETKTLYRLCALYAPEKYMKGMFFGSWEYSDYVYWSDIYEQYIPFNFEYLDDNIFWGTEDWLNDEVVRIIKQRLKDPGSLQIDDSSVSFYVESDNTGQMIKLSNGVYSGNIYFYVEYRAKNSFGGYVNSGIWLRLYEHNIYWTGLYNKYDMMTYGDSKELDHIGGMFIEYNSQI